MIIVRDILKLGDTAREARKIMTSKEILVDGKPRRDTNYPVGLMDAIEIPKLNKAYRMVSTSRGLSLIEIPKDEAKLKLCRIKDKTITKGGILQLNLHDGKNILIEDKKVKYNTGDSILIQVPEQKITKHLRMDKGSIAMITGGQNIGRIAKVKDIIIRRTREPNKIICEEKEKEFEAIVDYVFVVGENKPEIKVVE
jgi:small subunit ribosomal protein S4e